MPVPDVGVVLPSMTAPGKLPGDVAAAARHAEDLGLESVWAVAQGASRVVVTFAGGDWGRQAELLTDARALLI